MQPPQTVIADLGFHIRNHKSEKEGDRRDSEMRRKREHFVKERRRGVGDERLGGVDEFAGGDSSGSEHASAG